MPNRCGFPSARPSITHRRVIQSAESVRADGVSHMIHVSNAASHITEALRECLCAAFLMQCSRNAACWSKRLGSQWQPRGQAFQVVTKSRSRCPANKRHQPDSRSRPQKSRHLESPRGKPGVMLDAAKAFPRQPRTPARLRHDTRRGSCVC